MEQNTKGSIQEDVTIHGEDVTQNPPIISEDNQDSSMIGTAESNARIDDQREETAEPSKSVERNLATISQASISPRPIASAPQSPKFINFHETGGLPQSHGAEGSGIASTGNGSIGSNQLSPIGVLSPNSMPNVPPHSLHPSMPSTQPVYHQASNQQQPRMELQDAFAYLDRVKAEFSEQPEVYNKFLQIMREFKANTIDANGVIFRVVTLFKGHKTLIQGFNAFLPKTHHIDPTVAETGVLPPHILASAVQSGLLPTTSTGQPILPGSQWIGPPESIQGHNQQPPVLPGNHHYGSHLQHAHSHQHHQHQNIQPHGHVGLGHQQLPHLHSHQPQHKIHLPPVGNTNGGSNNSGGGNSNYYSASTNVPFSVGQPGQSGQPLAPAVSGSMSARSTVGSIPLPSTMSHQQAAPMNVANSISSGTSISTTVPPGAASGAAAANAAVKKSSPQFHRAIGYVKKIKHRFTNEPEVYKAFLSALHSYHKEQRSIHEVYAQVASLFRDHPDLLEEFVQFLPEHDASALTRRDISTANSISGQAGFRNAVGGSNVGAMPSGIYQAQRGSKRSAGVSEFSRTAPGGGVVSTNIPTKISSTKRLRQATANLSAGYSADSRPMEEIEFFDKVRRYLGSKTVYAEFLKCLNLFSQDILKMNDLLSLVFGFIGGNEELFGWFKRYIGAKDINGSAIAGSSGGLTEEGINGGVDYSGSNEMFESMDRGMGEKGNGGIKGIGGDSSKSIVELNLNACRRIGSYRILPKSYKISKASGRTLISDEVLNDVMVSCPSFTSEDSTFVGSKKNQYEEALFRCEDERYELDLLIDHNLATIAILEPLSKKLEAIELSDNAMAMEDGGDEAKINGNDDVISGIKSNGLKLGSNLGGTSEIIYRKAIKKIYGDKSEEVMEGLMNNAAAAVPIVLARLKQKDEEWRRIQREWNRIWREVHVKNYYKALDHQGIEYKANDRKNFSARSLILEIEGIQQERKRAAASSNNAGVPSSSAHLEFTLDTSVLGDLVRLVQVYLRTTTNLSSSDRKNTQRFLRSFINEFFGTQMQLISEEERYGMVQSADEEDEDNVSGGDDNVSGDDEESSGTRSRSRGRNGGKTKAMRNLGSGGATSEYNIGNQQAGTTKSSSGVGTSLLFSNNALFVLMRLLQIGAERLGRMKQAAIQANGQSFFVEKTNIVASFLDLQGVGNNNSFSTNIETTGSYSTSNGKTKPDKDLVYSGGSGGDSTAAPPANKDFYKILIGLLGQLVSGNLEIGIFEERVRFMFGNGAYPVFTFDKLIQAIVKQSQAVLADTTSDHLLRIFEGWRIKRERSSHRHSEYSARIAAESIMLGSGGSSGGGGNSNNASSSSGGRDNIYRIEYDMNDGVIKYQILDRLDGGGGGYSFNVVDGVLQSNELNIGKGSTVGLAGNGAGVSIEGTMMIGKWARYVDNFIRLETNPEYIRSHSRVYLARSLPSRKDGRKDGGGNKKERHDGRLLGGNLVGAREKTVRKGAGIMEGISGTNKMMDGKKTKSIYGEPDETKGAGIMVIEYNLECKICVDTYKLFYVENTEDFLYRQQQYSQGRQERKNENKRRVKNNNNACNIHESDESKNTYNGSDGSNGIEREGSGRADEPFEIDFRHKRFQKWLGMTISEETRT